MSAPKIIAKRYAIDPKAPLRFGGMSTVHAAFDLENGGRKVAVKIFKGDALTLEDPVHRLAFERESMILQRINHPNIVALVDWGREEGTRFIVFDWIERSLFDLLDAQPLQGWDDFHDRVGGPLLGALQFAFQHDIIHRDVKPQNVLVDESGCPKLADFSIARYRASVQLGQTLSGHRTPFYSPAEYDDGRYSDSRDVYGFAALAVRCLTGIEFDSEASFDNAVAELDIPDEVFDCLKRALAKEPIDRYSNVLELAEDLGQLQRLRKRAWVKRPQMYAALTKRAAEIIGRDPLAGDSVDRVLIAALNERCLIRVEADTNTAAAAGIDPVFKLLTPQWSFLAKIARTGMNHLEIVHALPTHQWAWEREQESGWCPEYEFRLGLPPVGFDGSEAIVRIVEGFELHRSHLEETRVEEQKTRLLRVWSGVLAAKEAVELSQRHSIRFRAVRRDGARLRIATLGLLPEESIGETWILKDASGAIFVGELEDIRGEEAVLWVDGELPDEVPGPGELVADTRAAKTALQRQRAALDAVQYGRAVRSDARELLLDPSKCRPPEALEHETLLPADLDPDKVEAVRRALATRDCLVVAGPPGTGKTRFIEETIASLLSQRPGCKILLAAQTHVAVDNALERVRAAVPELKALRIGWAEDERVAPGVRDCLIGKLAEQWAQRTAEKSKRYILQWAKRQGLDPAQLALGQAVRGLRLALEEEQRCLTALEMAKGSLEELNRGVATPPDQVETGAGSESESLEETEEQQAFDRIAETTRAYRAANKRVREANKVLKTLPEGAELSGESAQELSDWEQLLLTKDPGSQRYVALLDLLEEWHARLGDAEDFHDALFAEAQVVAGTCIGLASARPLQLAEFDVCLLDEASKATVTEALVPLVRARTWILVGDSKQLPPFVDEALQAPQILARHDLREEDIRETLLARLEVTLPDSCKTQLTYQRRMIPAIGTLISDCFYGGTLINPPKDDLPILSAVLPSQVTWYTTADATGRDELSKNGSYLNPAEAYLAVRVLQGLHAAAKLAKLHLTVGVLTAYRAQRAELQRRLQPLISSMPNLDIEINTVDAFQGREVDVALYSVVRANPANTLGFLRETRRLNVALSRGRYRLVIIGDHVFCRAAAGENPFIAVLNYIHTHADSCRLEALDAL